MKSKMQKLFIGTLACFTIGSILYIFAKETDFSVRLSVIIANLLLATLMLHAIHQTQKTRQILRTERDHLQDILDHIPLPLYIITKDRQLNFINAAALNLFHCQGDMIGQPCHCLNICICQTPACAITQMEQKGNHRTYYTANGKTYMVNTATLEEGTTQNGRYIELIEDITDVIEAQKLLEEKTLELETISENLIGGILITTMDEGYPVIRCNQGYQEMTGRLESQIIGQCAMQWVIPADAAKLHQAIQKQLSVGHKVSLEHRLHCADGTQLWVSLHGKRATLRGQQIGVWILTDISSIKEAELALKIDEERYRIAMQNTGDIIIDYDMKTHVMYHSSKAKEIYGVPELVENMPQSILDNGTVLPESEVAYLDLFHQLSANVKNCHCVLKTRAADGRILWNRLTFTAIFDDEGHAVRAIGILQDITREKTIEMQQQREARYLEISNKDGSFYYEADLVNRRFLLGHEATVRAYCDEAIDDFDTVLELVLHHKVYDADRELVRTHARIETLTENYHAGIARTRIEYRRIITGKPVWSECAIQCFIDATTENLHGVACIRNINEMKEEALLLQDKAERDLLTGLYNKITTELLIKNFTDFSTKDGVGGAFLLIDLDNFKQVNDTFGHACGDEVLTKVAKGLLSLFPQDAIIGRIGGDEFVAYMSRIETTETATKKARQICQIFHQIQLQADANYKISGTIGVAIFPSHGKNFDELYQNADKALYHAKEQGKDNLAIFTQDFQDANLAASCAHAI